MLRARPHFLLSKRALSVPHSVSQSACVIIILIIKLDRYPFQSIKLKSYLFVEEQNHRYGSQPAIVPDGSEKI